MDLADDLRDAVELAEVERVELRSLDVELQQVDGLERVARTARSA
jgi:DNA-binding response OmpR family regulator